MATGPLFLRIIAVLGVLAGSVLAYVATGQIVSIASPSANTQTITNSPPLLRPLRQGIFGNVSYGPFSPTIPPEGCTPRAIPDEFAAHRLIIRPLLPDGTPGQPVVSAPIEWTEFTICAAHGSFRVALPPRTYSVDVTICHPETGIVLGCFGVFPITVDVSPNQFAGVDIHIGTGIQ